MITQYCISQKGDSLGLHGDFHEVERPFKVLWGCPRHTAERDVKVQPSPTIQPLNQREKKNNFLYWYFITSFCCSSWKQPSLPWSLHATTTMSRKCGTLTLRYIKYKPIPHMQPSLWLELLQFLLVPVERGRHKVWVIFSMESTLSPASSLIFSPYFWRYLAFSTKMKFSHWRDSAKQRLTFLGGMFVVAPCRTVWVESAISYYTHTRRHTG